MEKTANDLARRWDYGFFLELVEEKSTIFHDPKNGIAFCCSTACFWITGILGYARTVASIPMYPNVSPIIPLTISGSVQRTDEAQEMN